MHEMAIAQGVLDITLDNAAGHQAKKVTKINLLIGQMTGVEPEALRFCFSTVAQGTIAAEAELAITGVPLVAECQDCGRKFDVEGYRFLCSACGSAKVAVISGRELRVDYLEVD
ncbi:hydrogenase maturation nickel metallochaperone HypA [Acetonema longum]|uniref:Hydrogenase maturation factor HypA n=1 Tax=Acetonema longum DSM 6540 TaxID=1009370 RepID=F7NIS4_9FIRM|nr:hydrogenase maturation nickel metallochaperone HypA [Acetonema longum]EGO64047.1 hydrogenase expression/synthesis HypA [Acetonema longum DSM 6540]